MSIAEPASSIPGDRPATTACPAPRVVLDTNVVLDCFAFDDPIGQRLVERLERGELVLMTRADLREELIRVLGYAHLPFDAERRSAALVRYDAHARPMTPPDPARMLARLPVCRDPDDQKFLEAARDGCADVLVSKDKALLELARSRMRPTPFRILKPEALLSLDRSALAGA